MTPQEKDHYTKLAEHYNSDRDCPTCINHTEKGCRKWDCEYEKRMSVEEIIKILYTIPTISEQVDALEAAIRSLEAWEKVKDDLRYSADIVHNGQNAFTYKAVLALIDKALGEVGESE